MVVVGGTISAAALTLVLLPMTYYWARRLAARVWRPRDDAAVAPAG